MPHCHRAERVDEYLSGTDGPHPHRRPQQGAQRCNRRGQPDARFGGSPERGVHGFREPLGLLDRAGKVRERGATRGVHGPGHREDKHGALSITEGRRGVDEVGSPCRALSEVPVTRKRAVQRSHHQGLPASWCPVVPAHRVVERRRRVEATVGRVREPVPQACDHVLDAHPGMPLTARVEVQTDVGAAHHVREPDPPRVVHDDVRRTSRILADHQRELLLTADRQRGKATRSTRSPCQGRGVKGKGRTGPARPVRCERFDDAQPCPWIASQLGELSTYLVVPQRESWCSPGAQPARPE